MKLPYTCHTAFGDTYEIEFQLHDATENPMRTGQLVDAILGAIDRDIDVCGDTSNGDVLQALAMAMAIRSGMIHAPKPVTDQLARDLLDRAIDAMSEANQTSPETGHA
ncbi:MAG: hypothetical protein ACMVY4_05715 [Minwuia sp.]|uniref:hypothetical protein n=1 Tax=Minwuia sp. TaxID=2493630 RepID=UPI003A83A2C2